ncbi:MAG: hypothetical protein K5888_03280 [Lachnospiraceae bacterium]|nr:hypothetical protein [Lachnospiraceae bacterium]
MNGNKKIIMLVVIFTVFILLMMVPGIISFLMVSLGPFFPILFYILIIVLRARGSGGRRSRWTEYREQDIWEDNRNETEFLGREIHDKSAILKKLYDLHYGVVGDGLFNRYHDAMYRVSRGECSTDLLSELQSLIKAYSMYENPEYRERQRTQNTSSGPRSYYRQPEYQQALFHPFLGKTKHFKDCQDFDSAKKKYYRLMKETHPDNSSADAELCAELNSEFDNIQKYFGKK